MASLIICNRVLRGPNPRSKLRLRKVQSLAQFFYPCVRRVHLLPLCGIQYVLKTIHFIQFIPTPTVSRNVWNEMNGFLRYLYATR